MKFVILFEHPNKHWRDGGAVSLNVLAGISSVVLDSSDGGVMWSTNVLQSHYRVIHSVLHFQPVITDVM